MNGWAIALVGNAPWKYEPQPCRKGVWKYLVPTSPWYGEGHQLRSYGICSTVLCLVAE